MDQISLYDILYKHRKSVLSGGKYTANNTQVIKSHYNNLLHSNKLWNTL
jgi:hypothetical protein